MGQLGPETIVQNDCRVYRASLSMRVYADYYIQPCPVLFNWSITGCWLVFSVIVSSAGEDFRDETAQNAVSVCLYVNRGRTKTALANETAAHRDTCKRACTDLQTIAGCRVGNYRVD